MSKIKVIFILFIILNLLVNSVVITFYVVAQNKSLVINAEYNIKSDYILLFPINLNIINNCNKVDINKQLIGSIILDKTKIDLNYSNNIISLTYIYPLTIYTISDNNVTKICEFNKTIIVREYHPLSLLAATTYNNSISEIPFLFYIINNYSIVITKSRINESIWPIFDNRDEAARLAETLEVALQEAGIHELRVIMEKSNEKYIVYVNLRYDIKNVTVINLSGYFVSISPPPGKDYVYGDLTIPRTETGAATREPAYDVATGDDSAAVLYGSRLFVFYRVSGNNITRVFVGTYSSLAFGFDELLYDWTSGVLLEASFRPYDPAVLAAFLLPAGGASLVDKSYPIVINGYPPLLLSNESSLENDIIILTSNNASLIVKRVNDQIRAAVQGDLSPLDIILVSLKVEKQVQEVAVGTGNEGLSIVALTSIVIIIVIIVLFSRANRLSRT